MTIPAGIETGTQIRLTGEGEPGRVGGPAGDLYVSVRVKAHPFFERNGYDIFIRHTVNIAQASLGAPVVVPTLEGDVELAAAEPFVVGKWDIMTTSDSNNTPTNPK